MSRGTLPLLPIIVVILLVVGGWRLSPLWPGPPLPPGATSLHIRTQPPHLIPNLGCPDAALGPVRIEDRAGELVVLSAETGEQIQVVWPSGWVAWSIDGQAMLVDRDGSIVVREGEVIESRLGGGVYADGAFHICNVGW
jgi:hypothetical protein